MVYLLRSSGSSLAVPSRSRLPLYQLSFCLQSQIGQAWNSAACMCISKQAYIYIHVYLHAQTCICKYAYRYTSAYVHVSTHARSADHIHVYIHIYIYVYIYTYIHTCIHTYVRTYIHTYIHTHTYACHYYMFAICAHDLTS